MRLMYRHKIHDALRCIEKAYLRRGRKVVSGIQNSKIVVFVPGANADIENVHPCRENW